MEKAPAPTASVRDTELDGKTDIVYIYSKIKYFFVEFL
jgi:hypothetical protein